MTAATAVGTVTLAEAGPWSRYGWLVSVVWLVFLIYPIVALAQSEADPLWVVVGAVATAVFAVGYVVGFVVGMRSGWLCSPRLVWRIFGVLVVCPVLTIPAIGDEVLTFLPFFVAYAGFLLARSLMWVVGAVTVVVGGTVAVFAGGVGQHVAVLIAIALAFVMTATTTTLIEAGIHDQQTELALSASRERETIARDVHDLIGHTLTVVKLKADLAARLVTAEPDRAAAEIEQVSQLAAEAIASVRRTVTGMQATTLADQLAASAAALSDAGVSMTTCGEVAAISPVQSLTAGWILREATTNILRHAGARAVRVEVGPGRVTIEDDGQGVAAPVGNGIRSMTERAAQAGARLDIEPVHPTGTRVSVTW
ncbi:sensor histidine kinase [Microbacterium sp.]|uniref:sensor histidine kinase n=1 Tax=Microbacterium sp. TaxID=51671 RepID=UPI003A84F69A